MATSIHIDVTSSVLFCQALESLDSRLSNPQRSTLALPNWRAAVQGAGAAMGAEVGGRLSALLRKWAEAPQARFTGPVGWKGTGSRGSRQASSNRYGDVAKRS